MFRNLSNGVDGSAGMLGRHIDTLTFISDVYRDDITIEGGCLREECAALYYPPDAVLPREELAIL